MNISIKKISLTNFKGVREFSAEFNDGVTDFRGDNATGKTTLFDAFTWCLYDKDSFGRSNFQIKTLDENNVVIWKQPHEVAVTLDIDGVETVEIRKSYKEVWKKTRGKSEEEFAGHTTERFWNDVPVKEKEFNEKIAEICKEETFRLITNPTYFLNNLSVKDQRNFLINLAGEITPETIASKYPEFQKLVEDMSGKTAEEYNREIAAQIKRLKTESESLPARIDERKRDVPEAENWELLQNMIDAKNDSILSLENQKKSEIARYDVATEEQRKRVQKKSDLEIQYAQKKSEIESEITKEFYALQSKQNQLKQQAKTLESNIDYNQRNIESLKRDDKILENRREKLVAEFHEIKKRVFDRDSIDRSKFVCPTCKRQLEEENIDEQIERMEANFNAETSRLREENKQKGLSVKAQREDIQKQIDDYTAAIAKYKQDLEIVTKDSLFSAVLEKPDTSNVDERIDLKSLKDLIAEADEEIRTHIVAVVNTTEIDSQISAQRDEIQSLKVRLSKKEIIEKNNARIAELEKQFQIQNARIAELEGVQFQIAEFKKTLIGEVETTINAMFKYVKFKMYETQINGGERETCEALVNGVPYSTNVNTAARINAGIDIINAICYHENVFAPIFVDNRESITTIIDTDSQIINLIKDENYQILTRM